MDNIDDTTVRVRADTRAFAADVAAMRATLDGSLGFAAERAGLRIESALTRAVRTGNLGFEDLRRVALGVMNDIARASIAGGLASLSGGGSKSSGGLLGLASSLLGAALGVPGRATGGPVSGGRAYMVGERGPELFVPTSAGRVETLSGGAARREVSITINVAPGTDPARMAQSSRRVALAVRRVLDAGEG